MARWQELLRRLRHLTGRSRFDDELRAEMQFHVDMRAAELATSGMSRADALSKARREFGSDIRLAEETREAWRFQWLQEFASDVRYALRSCRRHPAFALTVGVSLALGIGANSAVFTAVDALLFEPLPVREPEGLVLVSRERASGSHVDYLFLEYVRQLRDSDVFADVTTAVGDGLSFTLDGRAERIMGEAVSPDFFPVLGVTPVLGQGFSSEVRAGRWAAEAVLSHNFWKRRFGGDRSVIGRRIWLNSYPFTVVGVSAPGFLGVVQGLDPEVRIPVLPEGVELAQIELASGSGTSPALAIARLLPGVTMAQAEAVLNSRLPEFTRATTNPGVHRDAWTRVRVLPGARGLTGNLDPFHTPLLVLLAVAATVLVIACANVASMLLARATARQRELSIRVSIGAGRVRLVRQLLAESLLLALIGGALAVPFAYATAQVLPRFLPRGHLSLAVDLHPDARVIAFTAALALLTGVLIGVMPAFQATRGDLTGALKADTAASVGGRRGTLLRRGLVAGQIAFSLVMLVVSALFVRSLPELRPSDFGGRTDQVLLFTMKPQRELYGPDRIRVLAGELVRRMRAVPGVQA
ncbi:MAG: ABC transporter permease, partial [Longimicrobiales bacterium]